MPKRVRLGEIRGLDCKKFQDEESGSNGREFLREVDASEESRVPAIRRAISVSATFSESGERCSTEN